MTKLGPRSRCKYADPGVPAALRAPLRPSRAGSSILPLFIIHLRRRTDLSSGTAFMIHYSPRKKSLGTAQSDLLRLELEPDGFTNVKLPSMLQSSQESPTPSFHDIKFKVI